MDSDNEIKSVPSDVKQTGEESNVSSELGRSSISSGTNSVETSVESSRKDSVKDRISNRSGSSSLKGSALSSDKKSGSFKRSSMSSAFSETSEAPVSESRFPASTPATIEVPQTVTRTVNDEEDDRPFFANPFDSNMEKNEKMLRYFLLFGILPFPVISWIIGLFVSLTIKKKKKIHRKLTSALFLLSVVSLITGIIILGYFLVKNTDVKKKEDSKPAVDPVVVVDPKVVPVKPEPSPVSVPDPVITPGVELGDIVQPDVIVQDVISTKQVPGDFKPILYKEYVKPVFKFEAPKLEYIPPDVLEPPVTISKETKDLKFDYFEYKHPKSKNHMIILMRELDPSWKWHPMFRFSEYIDNTVLVINLTKNEKNKTITEVLEDLEKEFKIRSRTPLTLVADLLENEMVAFERVFSSMKIKRIFAINPLMRCDEKEIKNEYVQFASLFDDKLTCGLKAQEFPLMLTINGRITYTGRSSGLTDLKSNLFKNKDKCDDTIKLPQKTKIYLDKIYPPLRKFLSTATDSIKTNELVVEALCSKIAEVPVV